jgi:hypothetical protein
MQLKVFRVILNVFNALLIKFEEKNIVVSVVVEVRLESALIFELFLGTFLDLISQISNLFCLFCGQFIHIERV